MLIKTADTRDDLVHGLHYVHANGAQVAGVNSGAPAYRADVAAPTLTGCSAGQQGVPKDKFNSSTQKVADEWQAQLGAFRAKVVLVLPMDNCGDDKDRDGVFLYPAGFVRPRPDLGVSFFDRTMVTVTGVDVFTPVGAQVVPWAPAPLPLAKLASFGACQNGAACTAEIAAPSSVWHLNAPDPNSWPNFPTNFTNAATTCGNSFASGGCFGVSYAAPLVAGTAILILSNEPLLGALNVKNRILDSATEDPALAAFVEHNANAKGGRLLNVRATLP